MKLSHVLVGAAFAGEALALWGSKSAYNKWHETELERWLSDHNIPYPSPADRKDLEKIVNDNWQTKVVNPYQEWDSPQLQNYLSEKGQEIDKKKKEDKSWLLESVKNAWYETESAAEEAFGGIKNWIFDSWTESQLKAFLDRHGIPNPNPRTRDSLISTARDNYDTVATKLGETAAYPGNWLYESWTESELKKWLDERGIPAPQPSSRDKLIASVRRNSRLASLKLGKSASDTKQTVSDAIFNTWSDSSLKEFLDKNGVKVPQGSTHNELLALARRNKAYYTGGSAYDSAASAGKSATDKAGEKVAQATGLSQQAFDKIIEEWSDTRLKEYLDSRGVPVPQNGKRDELLAQVRLNKHKATTGYGAWTFDTWTIENLKDWLSGRGQKVSDDAQASRDQLYSSVVAYYSSIAASGNNAASSVSSAGTEAASSASDAAEQVTGAAASGGNAAYASLTSALAQATDTVKDTTFETWSDSDLKSYLDTYGIKSYQGSTRNEMLAAVRRNAHAFRYGSQDMGVWGQVQSGLGWLQQQVTMALGKGGKVAETASDRAHESAQSVADGAKEKAQQGYDRVKEEL